MSADSLRLLALVMIALVFLAIPALVADLIRSLWEITLRSLRELKSDICHDFKRVTPRELAGCVLLGFAGAFILIITLP